MIFKSKIHVAFFLIHLRVIFDLDMEGSARTGVKTGSTAGILSQCTVHPADCEHIRRLLITNADLDDENDVDPWRL